MAHVVDTSMAIKWFVEEEGRETSLKILEAIGKSPADFSVPELFYFELVHVFNNVVPNPNEGQTRLMRKILELGMNRFSMTSPFFARVQTFQKIGLSGYDAAYVTVAEMIRGKWLTFDRKAHRKIAHLHLSELLA